MVNLQPRNLAEAGERGEAPCVKVDNRTVHLDANDTMESIGHAVQRIASAAQSDDGCRATRPQLSGQIRYVVAKVIQAGRVARITRNGSFSVSINVERDFVYLRLGGLRTGTPHFRWLGLNLRSADPGNGIPNLSKDAGKVVQLALLPYGLDSAG